MGSSVIGAATLAAALCLGLSGCGSGTQPAGDTTAPPGVVSRDGGAHPTIATYFQSNGITDTPVRRGDPGSPTVDLPLPDGWTYAGHDTPDWAYDAITYTGPEASRYTPSVVALLSRLSGDADPQTILDLASGELRNLPGYEPIDEGRPATLAGYPSYRLSGIWVQDAQTKIIAQTTAVISAADGTYILQLNSDGLQEQSRIVTAATDLVDTSTVITTGS